MNTKTYIHPSADVKTKDIGDNCTIWQNSVILDEAKIGNNCNINANCFVENDVIIGDNVTIKCGVQIWDGIHLEDNVFVGPNATFCNDKFPKSKIRSKNKCNTIIKKNSSIGGNATILPNIIVNEDSMVGAGSVVTKDVPRGAIVVGNPAKVIGYTKTNKEEIFHENKSINDKENIYNFKKVKDIRGSLIAGEFPKNIPFLPKRYFLIYDVPNNKVRGEHAHKKCHQLLSVIQGTVNIILDDGTSKTEYLLDNPSIGLHIKPNIWSAQYKYSKNAILLVMASEHYDENDYIRDYDLFLEWIK